MCQTRYYVEDIMSVVMSITCSCLRKLGESIMFCNVPQKNSRPFRSRVASSVASEKGGKCLILYADGVFMTNKTSRQPMFYGKFLCILNRR